MSDIHYHGPVAVFDLDDTLFRERDFCRSGFRFLTDPALYKVVPVESYPSVSELEDLRAEMERRLESSENPFTPFEDFFKRWAENFNLDWNLQDHIAAYRDHKPGALKFAENVEETLLMLSKRGIRMGLITDGRSNTQRRKIEALKLSRFISPDMIFISEETGTDKTSKDMFVRIVREFPEASRFFYVGDNVAKDFFNPNLLGWITVRVPESPDNVHSFCTPESELYLPQIQLKNFQQLIDCILK